MKTIYKQDKVFISIREQLTNIYEFYSGKKAETFPKLNDDEENEILKEIIEKYIEPLVKNYDINYRFNQNQFDALISFTFNFGNLDKLTNFGLKTIDEISSSIINDDFIFINGIKITDLKNIRQLEKEMFDKK